MPYQTSASLQGVLPNCALVPCAGAWIVVEARQPEEGESVYVSVGFDRPQFTTGVYCDGGVEVGKDFYENGRVKIWGVLIGTLTFGKTATSPQQQ